MKKNIFKNFVNDNYSKILSLDLDKTISLKIGFDDDSQKDVRLQEIRNKLSNDGYDRASIEILEKENQLKVTVSTFLGKEYFANLGFTFEKNISRFTTNQTINTIDFPGLDKVGNEYHF